jgi:putative colanic acid biosynthesis acetyltransferase WcaF
MKVDLTKYDLKNSSFHHSIGASKPKQWFWFICSSLLIRNPLIPFSSFRKWILVLFGAKIGRGVRIRPGVQIKFPWKLTLGDHVWLGENCWIDNLTDVFIGDHSCVSQGAYLCTGNHDYTSVGFELILKPITLEDGVWIGAKAIVAPGVTCHSHSILTAGSVATKNMDAYGIYQGNPAVKLKERIIHPAN